MGKEILFYISGFAGDGLPLSYKFETTVIMVVL
jgi:hypothetical protein